MLRALLIYFISKLRPRGCNKRKMRNAVNTLFENSRTNLANIFQRSCQIVYHIIITIITVHYPLTIIMTHGFRYIYFQFNQKCLFLLYRIWPWIERLSHHNFFMYTWRVMSFVYRFVCICTYMHTHTIFSFYTIHISVDM